MTPNARVRVGVRIEVMVRVRVGKVRKPYPNFQMVPLSMTFTMSALLNLKIIIFDHVTVIAALTCCCVPNFINLVHAFGLKTPITAECSMRRF